MEVPFIIFIIFIIAGVVWLFSSAELHEERARCTDTYIAGIPHALGADSGWQSLFSETKKLSASREPQNIHDRYAIAFLVAGRRVGYMPRIVNEAHALHMDKGGGLDVEVIRIDMLDPWKGVRIRVKNV